MNLDIWNKPAFTCLASRFPYGTKITEERLDRVDKAEDAIRNLGVKELRVRYHNEIARIEVNNEKIQLDCFNIEENRYRCNRCKNTYQIGFELLPKEDILESSHELEEEEDSAGLLCAENEFSKVEEDNKSKSDIPIPTYLPFSYRF